MASIRLTGAACAGLLAFVSTTAAAQGPTGTAPAQAEAAVWQLRSGLNVAALACRGADEAAIVAGYNRLLADHRAELAAAYRQVERSYGGAASFDAAMTRTYNTYAQPAAQAALCANALDVLDAVASRGDRPLGEVADLALARLAARPAPAVTAQVAVVTIPQFLGERLSDAPDHAWRDDRPDRDQGDYAEEDPHHDAPAYPEEEGPGDE